MSKRLLIEEITRIHEMMGIKSIRSKNLLTEAVISPAFLERKLYSDVFKQEMVDWADNTLQLTKKDGTQLSFDDLVKYGRELASDVGLSEAEALLKVIGRSSKGAAEDITSRIMERGFLTNGFAFKSIIDAETDATKKSLIKSFYDEVVGVMDNVESGTANLTDSIDDLNTLSSLVDSDTALSDTTKTEIKAKIKDTIDDLEGAKTLRDEATNFENTNPSDVINGRKIGDEIVTPPPSTIPDWDKLVVLLKSKIPDIDLTTAHAQDVKRLFEGGKLTQLEAENALYGYYKRLKDQADNVGGNVGKDVQEDAQKRLTSFYDMLATITGKSAEVIAGIFKAFSRKKSALGGFINILVATIALALMDTAFDMSDDYITNLPIRDCLDEIPGFADYTDQAWWPSNDSKLRTLIVSEFVGDEKIVCGDETTGAPPLIKRITFQTYTKPPFKDHIAIVYTYTNNCSETFVCNKDWSKGTWVGDRCDGSTPPTPTPTPTPTTGTNKTLTEFQTYVTGKATSKGLTVVSTNETATSFEVTLKDSAGNQIGPVSYSKDGSDWN